MAQTSVGHVFISYSRKDKAVMQRIAELLHERGINVWVDNEELVPGTPIWEEEIEKAIRGAAAVIVLLSPVSKKSKWVGREISFADENEVRIFPVLVRGDDKASIPIRLINIQRVDIRQNEDIGLAALVTELTQLLNAQKRNEFTKPVRKKLEKKEVKNFVSWGSRHLALVTALVGTFIIIVVLAIWFATDRINNSHAITPVATTATTPAELQPVSDIPTPNCRPSGNQSPTIVLKLEPVRVRVYERAELTISVSDPENDPYEILAITAEKGQFSNGQEEPYLYDAPAFPGKDVITVLVGDHECRTRAEITINIE